MFTVETLISLLGSWVFQVSDMVGLSNTPNEDGKQVVKLSFNSIPDEITLVFEDRAEAKRVFRELSQEVGVGIPEWYGARPPACSFGPPLKHPTLWDKIKNRLGV